MIHHNLAKPKIVTRWAKHNYMTPSHPLWKEDRKFLTFFKADPTLKNYIPCWVSYPAILGKDFMDYLTSFEIITKG